MIGVLFSRETPCKTFIKGYKVSKKYGNILRHNQFIYLRRYRCLTSNIRLQFWLTKFQLKTYVLSIHHTGIKQL